MRSIYMIANSWKQKAGQFGSMDRALRKGNRKEYS